MTDRAWKDQNGQVHIIGHINHILIGFDSFNALFSGTNRVDNTVEIGFQNTVEDVVWNGTFYVVGTYNSNRFWMKNRFQVLLAKLS